MASATFLASAIPTLAVAVPFDTVMSFLTPLTAIPWPAAVVVIYVVSPVIASLLFAKFTSPLELLSPVTAKLTLLS